MKRIEFSFEYSSDNTKSISDWIKHNIVVLIVIASTILGGGGYLYSHWMTLRAEFSGYSTPTPTPIPTPTPTAMPKQHSKPKKHVQWRGVSATYSGFCGSFPRYSDLEKPICSTCHTALYERRLADFVATPNGSSRLQRDISTTG